MAGWRRERVQLRMKVMHDNESGSPNIVNIWADLGLPPHGTKLHELVRDGRKRPAKSPSEFQH